MLMVSPNPYAGTSLPAGDCWPYYYSDGRCVIDKNFIF